MPSTGECPVCSETFIRASTGRPRIYCCDNHRLVAFRASHPLGWRLIRELGIEDRSPLEMLRQAGVTSA
jgi:hypothetical protein